MLGEFQKKSSKRKISKLIYSWPVLTALLLAVGFLLFSTAKTYLVARQTIKELESIKADIIEIKEKKEALKSRIAEFESKSGLEKEIRKRFYAKKPGEELLVIIDREPDKGERQKDKNLLLRTFDSLREFFGI